MLSLFRGRYEVRLASSAEDVERAQALRWRSFVSDRHPEAGSVGLDRDCFDDRCLHVLVEDRRDGQLVCCFRLMPLERARDIGRSYSAQFYDLEGLGDFPSPMIEVGRFCMAAECHDPDVLRLAWGVLSRVVDAKGAGLLFGCTSFHGTDWHEYADAFALLAGTHIAPKRWLPKIKAPRVFRFKRVLDGEPGDTRRALLKMPPLLRSYLTMGGWVSDHAVVDTDLDTLHVFTGLEVSRIPAARAHILRMAAQ